MTWRVPRHVGSLAAVSITPSWDRIPLPALRTIGLLSESRKYHYAHTWTLLALAPNLETIYAANLQDCELPYRSWTPAFNGTFSSVRKVVAHNFGPIALATFVQSCPQLRDFQYAHTADFPSGPPLTYADIVEALKPVRKSLRRLAVLIQTEDGFLDEVENTLSHDPITPFEYLETLEELLIPHDAIYGRPDNEQPIPGGFASLLPRSIRNLIITYCDGGAILRSPGKGRAQGVSEPKVCHDRLEGGCVVPSVRR